MRPRKCRLVSSSPSVRFYKPRGVPLCELRVVKLKDEEWEAIQLADYKGMEREEAAGRMGISRSTFSRILSSARKGVARALTEGSALEIDGGDFKLVVEKKPKKKGKTK